MRSRRLTWILLSLLCLAGVWMLWQRENGRDGSPSRPQKTTDARAVRPYPPSGIATGHSISTNTAKAGTVLSNTNKFTYRLANTTRSIDQLLRDDRAILLENALIDTRNPLNLSIPASLRASGDPGAYIVQARGPIDNAFRAMLAQAGATIVSYIPNNAYLVYISQGGANGLAGNPLTQAVIPYEPYYKISSSMPVTVGQKTVSSAPMKTNRAAGPSLLALAVKQAPLPAGTCLTLGLFSDNAATTVAQLKKLGGQILAQDRSPFGPIVRVIPPRNWTALARLPGVQRVEPYHKRTSANDLSRVTVGVSTDTLVPTNYMNLTGSNVIVEVNDTGIDTNHPDFKTAGNLPIRIIGDSALSMVDTNGHGTHVAGIIAGDGTESTTVTNASGSIIATMPGPTATNGQFRGMAPLATLYSVAALDNNGNRDVSEQYLQEAAAQTNALISNNSWNYGDSSYDLAAASYDAAVRDALPTATGSQPVLFVFSAGNSGGGSDDGTRGNPDTILSPATAKNVITVGALEQLRYITNWVTALDGTSNQVWWPMTDSTNQVASYSSRGNVGIGFEGSFGRFKPDVVAPGTFVVSTRSGQWDTNTYYNPTNVTTDYYGDEIATTNVLIPHVINLDTTPNAVGVTIQVVPNALSPNPLNLPIYFSQPPGVNPDPATPGTYYVETNTVTIPPNGGAGYLADAITSGGFVYVVGDSGTQPISYDLIQDIFTTNDLGSYYQVLQGMNDSLGTSPEYYRYETGTSMAAADVSGVLALMQDFFTNQWHTLPSPALLKAMLINGARDVGYDFQVNNSINLEGWGLINLPSALQPGITNQFGQSCSTFILDQNPTNALATGDSQTFYVSVTDTNAQANWPLRITLTWTDPPGDPAAAIKLVNSLELVVTNLDGPTTNVFYGNDIAGGNTFNTPETTNTPPVFDSINNVQNVYISPLPGTNFSVTVVGYRVNVNAVTAQTNNYAGVYAPNVVQDYALVISSGDGLITNAMTVTTNSPIPGAPSFVSNPTGDQQITYVSGNTGPLLNQTVGANTPLMGTNALLLTNSIGVGGETNWQVTIGMTNQWHFYVVTNTFVSTNSAYTNAAFVTYIPDTLSIPRMGVFQSTVANATRPEADIDIYVTTDPTLTNLNHTAINGAASNYLASINAGTNSTPGVSATVMPGTIFEMASLSRGGTEYVVDTNSQPGEVYYIGVKSEDQMASEYAFMSVFSATPFSQMQNGNEIVTGIGTPVAIFSGNPAVPGYTDVVAIAIYPIQARRIVITNTFATTDFGDLVGSVYHNSTSVILNNHDSPNAPGGYTFIYDDSGQGDVLNSQVSDGPGSLQSFIGQQQGGAGVWILHEAANVGCGCSNAVAGFNAMIQPHRANNGTTIFENIAPCGWYFDYVDVPPGATNLTITVTNLTPSPQIEYLYVNTNANANGDISTLTNNALGVPVVTGSPPTNSVSIGPPLTVGRYYFGVFVPCADGTAQSNSITVAIGYEAVSQLDYTSTGPVPILDDAVTDYSIFVPDDATIYSVDVGLNVEHPRVSDLVFTLISPDGTRELLVENRGGTSTNGMGETYTNGTPTVTNYSHLVLTENTNLTTTPIKFAPPPFVAPVATNDLFYQPEQPMDALAGQNAFGTWTLEIQDDRAGASLTNWLTSWQLRFIFTSPAVTATVLTGGQPQTNTIPSGSIVYYSVAVPTNADFATNLLLSATGPVWVWFNQTNLPSGTNPPDYLLITNTTIGTNVLSTGSTPPLVPGQTYYIGLQNTNSVAVTDVFEVNFHFIPPPTLTNGVPVTNSIPSNYIVYYLVSVPTNADFATNLLLSATGSVWVWFNQTNLPSGTNPPDYLLITNAPTGTNTLSTNGVPPLVPSQTYYIGLQNTNSVAVTDVFEVNFHFIPPPTLTNGVPATNSIPSGSIVYYLVSVPANADFATNMLLSATASVNVWFNQTNLPSGTNPPDYLLITNTTVGTKVLSTNGVPPLVPSQTYYIGLQNTNSVAVTDVFEVNFHLIPTTNSYTTAMTSYWTNSAGVSSVTVECWGGGGMGSGCTSNSISVGHGGGGGGAYSESNVSVIPGNVYTIVVGAGGTTNSVNGGDSTFNTNIVVAKGGGGLGLNVTTGASGGQAINGIGTVKYSGGNGGSYGGPLNSGEPFGAGGGSSAGIASNGTNGGASVTNTTIFVGYGGTAPSGGGNGGNGGSVIPNGSGSPGSQPGGGGGGAIELTTPSSMFPFPYAGIGGAGKVRLTYTAVGAVASPSIIVVNGNILTPSSISVAKSSGGVALPAGNIAYYQVNVPVDAVSTTNSLVAASSPVNVWFNRTTLPSGTNSPDDYLLLGGVTNGIYVLDANGAMPNIVPGGIYWLGVQNTNSFDINYGFGVDFKTTNFVVMPLFLTTTTGSGAQLQWYPLSSSAQYQVKWTTNLSSPIVWATNADTINSNSWTPNWTFMFIDSGSTNSHTRFYRLIQLP